MLTAAAATNVQRSLSMELESRSYKTKTGLVEDIGKRGAMEDRNVIDESDSEFRVYGVFDGHGGSQVAQELAKSFSGFLKQMKKEEAQFTSVELASGFQKFDERFKNHFSGSTAAVAVITPNHLRVANVGDSEVLVFVCKRDGRWSTLVASEVHDSRCPGERERIIGLGGRMMPASKTKSRVNGILIVTRSFGDWCLSENTESRSKLITACPHVFELCLQVIYIFHLTRWYGLQYPQDVQSCFVLMASDGMWDGISKQTAGEACLGMIRKGFELSEVCAELKKQASGLGNTGDNTTIMLLCAKC